MATEPLDTLQLKIQSDASAAAKGLNELKDALKSLRSSMSRSKALNLGTVADEISKFAGAVNSVNTDKIERLAEAIKTIRESSKGLSSSMREATRATTAVQQATGGGRSTRPSRPSSAEPAPEDSRRPGGSQEEASPARQASGYAQVLATAKRTFSAIVSSARASFRVITNLVMGIGKAFLKVGDIAKTAFFAPLKAVGNSLSKIFHTVTGLIRSVGRIALYRAIRTAIKAVTQGLNEGIQNLYQWSLLVDRTFANSMDSIATSMQYLHNGFAAMFSPLINYAAPIIEEVTNRLVDFFNVVQQIFATLTGASTWTKAVRVQKQYAEAVTDTGKAAEKAMHQVMAFDELNIINSPNDSGSPGSGTNTPDYGSMFVTEEVDTGLKSWVEEIKKFFDSGDFRGLGEYIGDKLNRLVNRWTAYADGFIFGKKIRHALEALNGFLETFSFYDLGSKVGNWLGGFTDGIDPMEVQRAIVNILNSAVSGASGLIDSLVSHNVPIKIGQAIGTSFAMIDWEGLTNLIRKIMLSIVDMINAAASSFIANNGPQKLVDACKEIGSAIGEAFATVNWADVMTVLTAIFNGLVSLFSSAISSFVELGGPAKLKDAMGAIGTAIGEAFANIRGKDLAEIINSIVRGIVTMFKNAITAFSKGNGWDEVGELFKNLDWGALFTLAGIPLTIAISEVILKGLIRDLITAEVIRILGTGGGATGGGAGGGGVLSTAPLAMAGAVGVAIVNKIDALAYKTDESYKEMSDNISKLKTGTTRDMADAAGSFAKIHFWENFVSFLKDTKELISESWDKTKGFVEDVHEYVTESGSGYRLSSTDEMFPGNIGGRGGGTSTNPLFKNQMVRYSFGDPFGIQGMLIDSLRNTAPVTAAAANMGRATADSIKNGAFLANIPAKYREFATASLDEFGKTDFTSGGASSGDEIKTGVERSNIRGKFSEEADKAANAVNGKDFTTVGTGLGDKVKSGLTASNIAGTAATLATNVVNAFGAIKPTAAAMGATLGAVLASNFKAHFIANAKSNLMIQTAAGKPITQAYVVPYANGGYVQGGLFLAGEVAGQSEMVGSINGRTGVASGEEITGIREAVVATGDEEASLLRQLLTVGQALLMKDPFGTPNSAAGRWIAQSQQAYKAVTG